MDRYYNAAFTDEEEAILYTPHVIDSPDGRHCLIRWTDTLQLSQQCVVVCVHALKSN